MPIQHNGHLDEPGAEERAIFQRCMISDLFRSLIAQDSLQKRGHPHGLSFLSGKSKNIPNVSRTLNTPCV
jgi:hypothetical protein